MLLEVRQLSRLFRPRSGVPWSKAASIRAVDGVSFTIDRGETFALVGESGSGKTTTARLVLGIEKPSGGQILYDGRDTATYDRQESRAHRFKVQAVFQDPWSSLNPRMDVEGIVAEPIRAKGGMDKAAIRERVLQLIDSVGLPANAMGRFPHEFSGGQRQRIAIARALAPNPELIVLDEPVSSLDVSVRAQIMNLLRDIQASAGVSYLLIGHHLGTVRYLSQRVGVMYFGKVVELAPSMAFFAEPKHPYAQALLSASLPVHPVAGIRPVALPGEMPSAVRPPTGCSFHPRCPKVMPMCATSVPALDARGTNWSVACHLYDKTSDPEYSGTPDPEHVAAWSPGRAKKARSSVPFQPGAKQ